MIRDAGESLMRGLLSGTTLSRGGVSRGRVDGLLELRDESRHHRSEPPAAAMDDPDRPHQPGQRERGHRERAHPELVVHGGPRQDAHPRVDTDRLLHRLDVVELHDHLDLDVVLLEGAVDGVAHRAVTIEGYELLA